MKVTKKVAEIPLHPTQLKRVDFWLVNLRSTPKVESSSFYGRTESVGGM